MKALPFFFWTVDIGFLVYWAVTLLGVIPDAYLFKDYHDPILMAWNWSFLPLDLCISATGLLCLRAWRTNNAAWRPLALISLTLTSCSGLQAGAFWALRGDFDPMWWGLNLFLLIYPLWFIPKIVASYPKTVANHASSDL